MEGTAVVSDVLMRIMVDLEFKDFEEAVLVSEMCSSVFSIVVMLFYHIIPKVFSWTKAG